MIINFNHINRISWWYKLLFYVLSYLVAVWILSFLRPVGDDWGYLTTPHFDLTWNDLLPKGSYWRPLDVLFGRFLGFVPALFPLINHAFVALGHFISVYLLAIILRRLNTDAKSRIISVFFFAVSPGILAALFSVDSLNQTWALTFGAIGTVVYLQGNHIINKPGWILFSALAVLSKESGIIWFIATPLIGLLIHTSSFREINFKSDAVKHVIKSSGTGILFVFIYFFLRIIIFGNSIGPGSDYQEERYRMALFSFSVIKNVIYKLSSAFTSVDSLAFFLKPRSNFLLLITVLLNIPFLLFLLFRIIKAITSKNAYRLTGFLVIALIISSPHLVLSHSGEMHGYPTVFAAAMIISLLLDKVIWNKAAVCAILCYFSGAIITDLHKYNSMYSYGKSGEKVALTLFSQIKVVPEHVLLVMVEDIRPGHSVFWQNPLLAFYFGGAVKPYYNWVYPKRITNISIQRQAKNIIKSEIDEVINQNLNKYDCIWIINDDEIKVVNN